MIDEDKLDPESLLPAQQIARHRTSPTYDLAAAVIYQAAQDFQYGPRSRMGGMTHHSRWEWARVDGWLKLRDADSMGSFSWWCDLAGVDADLVEKRIRTGVPLDTIEHRAAYRRSYAGRQARPEEE